MGGADRRTARCGTSGGAQRPRTAAAPDAFGRHAPTAADDPPSRPRLPPQPHVGRPRADRPHNPRRRPRATTTDQPRVAGRNNLEPDALPLTAQGRTMDHVAEMLARAQRQDWSVRVTLARAPRPRA